MTQSPLVSVIIIFFNAADFLQEAIESVFAQTYENWELLLVDDGSNDGSSELARKYASQSRLRVHYLEHAGHSNRGMSASRNLGIKNAKGDFIAFLDADDYWLPEKLAIHAGILIAHPSVGMLYGTTKYWFSWTSRLEDRDRDFVPELRARQATLFNPPELLPLLLDGKAEVPCTCSVLIRKDAVQVIGGFEESFRGMYEDQAFYAKVCLSVSVLATGDCLAWYRQHPRSHSSVVLQSGGLFSTQYTFLQWLERYCLEHEIQDKKTLQMLRRKLWLNRQGLLRIYPKAWFWLKKWLLRAEERFLPVMIQNWLWMRK